MGWQTSPIASVRCADYSLEAVRAAVDGLLAPLGGMEAFVRPGERIVLKPNCLLAAEPGQAITTHPVVVRVVAELVRREGAFPVVVESPGAGIPHTVRALRRVYGRTGLAAMAEEIGLELGLDTEVEAVSAPGAVLAKRVDMLRAVREADGVISLPKLKTHTYMTFTGAVKNLFGVIPGYAKPGFHAKLADPGRFADMLLDVCGLVSPRLSVMDAVLALEGDGPGTAGRPRMVGALLAGADPVSLDLAACRMVGIEPAAVPVLLAAQHRGLVDLRAASPVLGVPLDAFGVAGFEWPRSTWNGGGFGPRAAMERALRPVLNNATNPRPRPRPGRCTACGVCARACPVGAVTVRDRLALVDDARCIRCYCCHELCPEGAVDLERTLTGRALRALGVR